MKKILVVDDEKPISDIIKFNMAKEGYEVLTAFDGREALEVFAAEKSGYYYSRFDVTRRLWFGSGADDS